MKKIIICCSISASDEVVRVKKELEALGYEVEIPYGVKKFIKNNYTHVSEEERAKDKTDNDLIRDYYKKIKDFDALLVVNPEKKNTPGYIGGNTFLEMGFGYVLGKTLYVLNPLPDASYISEIEAMKPIVLNGNLSLIK